MAFPCLHQHHLLPLLCDTVWTERIKIALTNTTTHVLCDNLEVYFSAHHFPNKCSPISSFMLFLPQDHISLPSTRHPTPSSQGPYQMSTKPCLISPPRSKCFLLCGPRISCWSLSSSTCFTLTYTILLQTWVVWMSRHGHTPFTEHPSHRDAWQGLHKYPLSICWVESVDLWLHGSDLNSHWLGHVHKHTYIPWI